jgi:integrase
MHLRRFLSYLYTNEHIKEDFSQLFAGIKPHRKEKLPSSYDINEVSKIEKAVERASAVGKRDYAMILLASRLGLRSSDIRGLKFSNLDWDNNLIRMQQYKTKRYITLPLLSDVGEALINYITNGRPSSSLKNVFVTSSHPYRELQPAAFSSVVSRYIYSSGIEYKGKHTGPHALRHSLATLLLKEGTGLPVISETLGHASTESTMYYLGVDTNGLLECSLEVPIVDESFYLQKGGLLYE